MDSSIVLEKGYATDPELKWIYPDQKSPPAGVKLHLLTKWGYAIHGMWDDSGFYTAWQYLPKRDMEHEDAINQPTP